jgi:hypothetical protein
MIFRLSAGVYNQPPFYRELKKYDGSLNYTIKSQKSIQLVTGLDYQFVAFNDKPFRLTTEAYYKEMRDVIPYDIDNVKIKYLGNNNAKAYATGLEVRLFSELIKDAESWISVGLMSTKENLDNDYYRRIGTGGFFKEELGSSGVSHNEFSNTIKVESEYKLWESQRREVEKQYSDLVEGRLN